MESRRGFGFAGSNLLNALTNGIIENSQFPASLRFFAVQNAQAIGFLSVSLYQEADAPERDDPPGGRVGEAVSHPWGARVCEVSLEALMIPFGGFPACTTYEGVKNI